MNKVVSISINEGILNTIRMQHGNISKYVEELIKADLYKSNEGTIKQQLLNDDTFIKKITEAVNKNLIVNTSSLEPVVIEDSQENW